MERPVSMSVKEWIIKKMSIKLVVPEKTINDVITHQFDSANDALNLHKSLEISGFGKFHFNQVKAEKQMVKFLSQKDMYENMLSQELTPQKRKNTEVRLENVNNYIKYLKPKL